jgi:hypothetical protein
MGIRANQLSLHECFRIHNALREFVEKLVRFGFFVQSSLQKLCGPILAKQFGKYGRYHSWQSRSARLSVRRQ